jgi:hypothetical protein
VYIRPINLVHFSHPGNEKNGRGFLHIGEGKVAKDLKYLLMVNFFNRSVITVLYVERKLAIYDCYRI